jgi:hypothetical protein
MLYALHIHILVNTAPASKSKYGKWGYFYLQSSIFNLQYIYISINIHMIYLYYSADSDSETELIMPPSLSSWTHNTRYICKYIILYIYYIYRLSLCLSLSHTNTYILYIVEKEGPHLPASSRSYFLSSLICFCKCLSLSL